MTRSWFSLVVSVAVLFALLPAGTSKAAAVPVHAEGSFIQPYAAYEWSVQDWKEELQALKEVGNQLIILQWTADTRSMQTIYPTAIPGLTQEANYRGDPVENLLTAADALHMQVWLGTNANDDWYIHHALNEPWLDELFGYSEQMVGELWNNYRHHPSLDGFYFPNEMENCSYQDDVSIANLTAKYASLANRVHNDTGKTLALAPAIWNERSCGQTFEQNSAAWIKTWDGILGGANIDYLIPQDGLGGGYHSVAEVVEWFRLTREVVDRHPATRLWADVETFHTVNPDPWAAEPMVTKDIVDHMTQISPHVDGIVTFSYDHYQSPKLRNTPIFHQAYKTYYKTGRVDDSPPKTPNALRSKKQGTDKISLVWHGAKDVFYYVVYRDGTPVGRSYAASYQDNGLQPGTRYEYQVEAYSASGYPSALSKAEQVTTASASVNLALGRPYESSVPASPSYPDTDGLEMTNGKLGAGYFWDPEWQGRSTEGAPLVIAYTVDLGEVKKIDGLSINFYQDIGSAIKLPRSVEYQVSNDNVRFESLGYSPFRTLNFGPTPPDLSTVSYGLLPSKAAKARYVKIIVTAANYGWTFSDELFVEQYAKVSGQDAEEESIDQGDETAVDPGLYANPVIEHRARAATATSLERR
ncbi:DUF4434 domain-containing protein [Cohnella nanjingensis]|uniref:DUF4434 domain-containing protein n=1 Tax=Cohnella nanjingensis TaxID=1387779 RepID=A0A7X0VFA1_9BACL|nr:DUF4434 domain-containing protein [Cohnella nanjingensis]MBB6671606.1 DUF4434 domain-containing protein [Cohnella nanjingensis]